MSDCDCDCNVSGYAIWCKCKCHGRDIEEKIKDKFCDICKGIGNYCNDINGKSVCGLCQIEGRI